MTRTNPICITTALIAVTSAATAQFSGAYAPDTWTVTGAGIGGSAATFAGDGSSLTIVGGNGGFGSDIDVTHVVIAGGLWTFDWSYAVLDPSPVYDTAYYLINGAAVYMSAGTLFGVPVNGSESIAVQAGDVIGWRIETIDGIFGPGVLTITNFQIPAPGAMALLALVGIARHRCRPVEPPGQA